MLTTLIAAGVLAVSEPPLVTVENEVPRPAARPVQVELSVSPLSAVFAGAAVEVGLRLYDRVTVYGAGEFYGRWMGWAAQGGVRLYPLRFDSFAVFVDLHGRTGDVGVVRMKYAAGAEAGVQHQLGSRFFVSWSLGADAGLGEWRWRAPTLGVFTIEGDLFENTRRLYDADERELSWTVMPKMRLMLGVRF